jgi:hypothetical protein
VGIRPASIVAGDFNGDGKLDLAVTNEGSDNVTVLLGALAATKSVLGSTAVSTITYGTPVPLTLQVSDTAGAFNVPTGTVTFLDGATILGVASHRQFRAAGPGRQGFHRRALRLIRQ